MNILNKGNSNKANFDAEKEQVNQLLDDGKNTVKEAYHHGKEQAENLYSQAKDTAHDLYSDSKKKIEHAQDALKGYSNDLVDLVKDKPLSSLLIASAVGYLIAALLKK